MPQEEIADQLSTARANAQRWASVAKRQDAMLQQDRSGRMGESRIKTLWQTFDLAGLKLLCFSKRIIVSNLLRYFHVLGALAALPCSFWPALKSAGFSASPF